MSGLVWFVVVMFVAAACGGGGSPDNAAGGADPEGSVIEGPAPTATAAPTVVPTPTPEPVPTPTPIPTATPVPGPEAEVIAAWERYLRLSIEARGKNPSPEALDFDSYVGGLAQDALIQVIADYTAAGDYVTGSIVSTSPVPTVRDDGAFIIEDCAQVNLSRLSASSDVPIEQESFPAVRMRGRLERRSDGMVVEGFELGGPCES